MKYECCDECNGDNLSDCCGAKYNDDTGICYECHDHADAAGCGDEDCECHRASDDPCRCGHPKAEHSYVIQTGGTFPESLDACSDYACVTGGGCSTYEPKENSDD